MSNLLKANLVKEEQTRIIDYNAVISEKLDAIRRTLLENGQGGDEAVGEFMAGLNVQTIELEPQPDPQEELERARAEAEELLARARAEAEELCSQARTEAEQIRIEAEESGRQQGYQEGSEQARAELEEMRRQLAEEEAARRKEYERQLRQLEPELVDTIIGVVSHVTFASLSEKRDIVLHLVENALEHIESSRQFLIHVSREDFPAVSEKKEELLEQVPQNAELEIIKDATLSEGQCMIETDGGIFDCGLDTRLNGLLADIRALSMQ